MNRHRSVLFEPSLFLIFFSPNVGRSKWSLKFNFVYNDELKSQNSIILSPDSVLLLQKIIYTGDWLQNEAGPVYSVI
jgi:hypothetical protein